jgi:type I restriction enzyme S subunit
MGEWPQTPFGDLLREHVRNGIYKSKEFHGKGAKIVNMGELFAYPRLRDVPMKRVELSSSELERFSLREGDLIFARRSLTAEGAGKCTIVLEVAGPTTFESSIIRARPNPKQANSLFLYYFFSSPTGFHRLDSIKRQVAVAGITGSDLARLTIPQPPLEEQAAIASILGALDDKIELNRQMNETLEAMARALFKDWFVDFGPTRAKMEGRTPYLAPEIWSLFPDRLDHEGKPEGWKISSVGVEFDLIMGQSPPGETYNENKKGLPFFQGSADFGFRYPVRRKYCSAPARIARPDDTLVSVRAPVGDLNMAWEACCIGRGVAAVRHKQGGRGYTQYSLYSVQSQIARYDDNGSVFGSINKAEFERLRVVAPTTVLIDVFEAIVDSIDDRIRLNTGESETLATTRDLLLPKLMSGLISVKDADKVVEKELDRIV